MYYVELMATADCIMTLVILVQFTEVSVALVAVLNY